MDINGIIINGVDCTQLFRKKNIPTETQDISGGNGGTMLTGKIVTDVIARHNTVSRAFRPLPLSDVSSFVSLLTSERYATVMLLDETTATETTKEYVYTVPTRTYLFTDRYGTAWYRLSDLILAERG